MAVAMDVAIKQANGNKIMITETEATEAIKTRAKQSQDLRAMVEGYRGKVERCDINQDQYMNISVLTSEQAHDVAQDLRLAGLEVQQKSPDPSNPYCDGLYRVTGRSLNIGGLTLPRRLPTDD